MQLRYVLEVHPVDRPYERWSEQDRRPRGDLLDLLVLVDARLGEVLDLLVLGQAHQGEIHAQDAREQLTEAIDPLGHLQDVVLYVTQVALQLGVYTAMFISIDPLDKRLKWSS